MSRRAALHGFTLVELMIALLLGLVIVGGVGSLFIANQQSYRSQEALSRVQEAGRLAFELIARDVRMAGNTGCAATQSVVNVLNNQNSDWWANAFGGAAEGYDGEEPFAAAGKRVEGTDLILVRRADTAALSIVSHNGNSAQFKVNKAHDFEDGDIAIVCDTVQTSVFQITNASSSNTTIVHNTGNSTPGNCSKFLGHPRHCAPGAQSAKAGDCPNGLVPCEYAYGADSSISKLEAVAYYVGLNPDGNRALYQLALTQGASQRELIEGIEDLQLVYGVDTSGDGQVDAYQAAAAVADWARVRSVQINLLAYSVQERVLPEPQAYTYTFDDTGPRTANDGRIRKAFTGTAQLRAPPPP